MDNGQGTTGLADSALDVISARVFRDLSGQLARVHKKRGALSSDMAALGVITEEYHEVREAMQRGEAWKVRAELLDLAIGCIRRVLAMDARQLTTDGTYSTDGGGVEILGDAAVVAALRVLVPWDRKGVPVVGSWEVLQGVADVLWGDALCGGDLTTEDPPGPPQAGGISDGSDGSDRSVGEVRCSSCREVLSPMEQYVSASGAICCEPCFDVGESVRTGRGCGV